VQELGPGDPWQDVGAFKGIDYFGDGSFYILEAEGVSRIHVSRTNRSTWSDT
jgi:hypothetical protein